MTEYTAIFKVTRGSGDTFTNNIQCLNCKATFPVQEFRGKPIPDPCPSCQMSAKEYWEKNSC